jgi:hypothetical protein
VTETLIATRKNVGKHLTYSEQKMEANNKRLHDFKYSIGTAKEKKFLLALTKIPH